MLLDKLDCQDLMDQREKLDSRASLDSKGLKEKLEQLEGKENWETEVSLE